MAKEKFQIGDKVKVNKTGKIGVINSSCSNGERRVYGVAVGSAIGFYYSYEIQKCEKTTNTKRNGHWPKVILEFDQSPFKDIDSKSAEQLKRIASKITVDDNVVKNRYGDTDIVERCIRLTLKEAQKMYKAGGQAKEFALQVFDEEELNPKPKVPQTWEDYCDNFYPFEKHMHYYPHFAHGFDEDDADAFIVYGRLIRLRKAWIGNWKADWCNNETKYCIDICNEIFAVYSFGNYRRPLSFPTYEMAEEFMNCFKDLLEKAKTVI